MDPNQQENQEEYTELQENVGEIDPNVLNTPAKEPKRLDQVMPTPRGDTFFHFNKPREFQPQQDVVLDVAGESTQLNTKTDDLRSDTRYFEKVFGDDFSGKEGVNPNIIFLGFIIFIGLFFFILFNIKKSEQISRLEHELEKMKRGN